MNTLEQTTELAIELIKEQQATDYEFSVGKSSGVSTSVRLSEVETLKYHLDASFDVSVYIGQNKGQATSVDLSKKSLKKAIESACLIAKYTQEDPFNGLAPSDRMAWQIPDLELYHPWNLDAKQSIDIAMECDTLFCSLIAKRNDEMQTAYEYGIALDANDLTSATEIGLEAAKLAQKKLGSRHLNPQKCPIIYTPRQSSGLFSQLLGALSGSRQYKKTSFLLDSLGKDVLPKTINVYEDPLQVKTLGARAFDQDGVLKKKQFFIENGRVSSYVMGQYSANQLGLESTANAGGVSNCCIGSNFDGGLAELTKDMGKGLIVTDLMGHGVNITTGNYSRGASGFWVENGEIQYPVSGITIAGNLKSMMKDIVSVGSDIDHRSNLKVGSTLISEMTISGEG